MTANVLAIATASCLYMYGLDVLVAKTSPLFIVDLKTQDAELLSYNIKHFDFMKEFILTVTEEGEFLKLEPPSILRPHDNNQVKGISSLSESSRGLPSIGLRVSQVGGVLKLEGQSGICCILAWGEEEELILLATHSNKVLAIGSRTHEIHDIW
jgi:hypothetical protein